jgi:large subunit ribosomal protein L22
MTQGTVQSGAAQGASRKRSSKHARNSNTAGGFGERGRATLSSVRISPQKLGLVLDLIRGKQVETALQILRFNARKGGAFSFKVLQSAIANATESQRVDVDSLWVIGAWADRGPMMKRFMPNAQGRAAPILKRSSHLTIVVGERIQ